jgi:hypothetical protein
VYDRVKLEREHEIMKSLAACLRASSVFVLSMKSIHVILCAVPIHVSSPLSHSLKPWVVLP